MKKIFMISSIIIGLIIYRSLSDKKNQKITFKPDSLYSWNGDIHYIDEKEGFVIKGENRYSGRKIPLWIDFPTSCHSNDEEYDKCSMGLMMSLLRLEKEGNEDLILARQFSTGPRLNGLEACKVIHQLKDSIKFTDGLCGVSSTGSFSSGPILIGYGWYIIRGYAGGAGGIEVLKYSPYKHVEPALVYYHSSGELPIEFIAIDSATLIVKGHKDPRVTYNYSYDDIDDLEEDKNGSYKYNHKCFWSKKKGFYDCRKI